MWPASRTARSAATTLDARSVCGAWLVATPAESLQDSLRPSAGQPSLHSPTSTTPVTARHAQLPWSFGEAQSAAHHQESVRFRQEVLRVLQGDALILRQMGTVCGDDGKATHDGCETGLVLPVDRAPHPCPWTHSLRGRRSFELATSVASPRLEEAALCLAEVYSHASEARLDPPVPAGIATPPASSGEHDAFTSTTRR
jgi:hypothetical protein